MVLAKIRWSPVGNIHGNVQHKGLTCVSSSKNNSWYWWAEQQRSFLWKHQTWARNPESHKRWLSVLVATLLRNTAEAAATHRWFSVTQRVRFSQLNISLIFELFTSFWIFYSQQQLNISRRTLICFLDWYHSQFDAKLWPPEDYALANR